MNQQITTEGQLADDIRTRLSGQRSKTVVFDIDDEASYATAVRLMDLVRSAGAKTLALETTE